MYNPPRFKNSDRDTAFELMDYYPFATIISVVGDSPFISHLPLTPRKVGDKIELIGHIAKANPHSRILTEAKTTAVFHGPHTYITPKWYAKNNVPTWNYSTVHVTGQVSIVRDYEGILQCLRELTNHIERHWPSGWEFYVPNDLLGENLTNGIVGFILAADEINFKQKLSQSSPPADRAGVFKGLEARNDENSKLVLADMLKLYKDTGEVR